MGSVVRTAEARPAPTPRRILIATDGTWGDVGPFVAVGAALRRRGHEVRALLNPAFAEAARAAGLEVVTAGEVRSPYANAARYLRPISGSLHLLREIVLPELPTWIRAAREAIADLRPDAALIHHLGWGPLGAAHAAGVPIAAGFLAPSVLLSWRDPARMIPGLPAPRAPSSGECVR